MPTINILNMQGENVGEVKLNPSIFEEEINEDAVHTVVVNHLANKRQGTQSVKTRSEKRGGGRKPWRQKGTGRARHGSSRSPLWVGGGVTFAPKPRDYSYTTPKKIKRLAMRSALSSKLANKELIIIDEISFDQPKTKEMVSMLEAINADKKSLIVIRRPDRNIIKSASNIPNVYTTNANTLNVYDILNCDSLIITKDALDEIQEVFA